MFAVVFAELDWLAEGYWLAPAIGGAACLLAYLLGRLFLVARPAPAGPELNAPDEANFLRGLNRDRRAAPRRRGNSVEVEMVNAGDETPVRGWVVDRSIGGLGVLVDNPIAAGTVLRVRPRFAKAGTPWTEVTVRSSRPEGGQHELGCQFHRTPNWSLLLMFG
jgi:hypothetical protein